MVHWASACGKTQWQLPKSMYRWAYTKDRDQPGRPADTPAKGSDERAGSPQPHSSPSRAWCRTPSPSLGERSNDRAGNAAFAVLSYENRFRSCLRLGKDVIRVPEARSPAVRRRELGALLRELRTESGLTVEQVADRILCSPSKISRMETGHRGATLRDIRDLCDLYGVADTGRRELLTTLAREGKQQGWWQSYDLPYPKYAGLEAEAVAIRGYQSSVIPGLLQTADYARAIHEGAIPRLDEDVIDQRVAARLIRQQLLTQESPPHFFEVLDEAALHRTVGGVAVLREQLDGLIEACRLPSVTVQVIPFAAGAHPALENNFKILDLPPPSPSVVYTEGLAGSFYLERAEDIEHYELVFEELKRLALTPADAVDFIAAVRDTL